MRNENRLLKDQKLDIFWWCNDISYNKSMREFVCMCVFAGVDSPYVVKTSSGDE